MPNTPRLDLTKLEHNIKILLQSKKLNQQRLADELHMSQSMFNKRLKGHPCFSIEDMYTIAQFFHVSIDSLCSIQFSAELVEPETPPEAKITTFGQAAIYETCKGLASVFKHSILRTDTIRINETTYEEDLDELNRPTGHYSLKKDVLNMDPEHRYPYIYFSNYWKVDYTFAPDEDPEEYFNDLDYGGNFNQANYQINKFLQKLVDLHETFDKGSIQYEDYCRSIDNLLTKIPKQ